MAKASKKLATNVLKSPGRALCITAKIATAAAGRNPKYVMRALPELKTSYNTGKGLYLGKFVYNMVYKWIKNVKGFTHLYH